MTVTAGTIILHARDLHPSLSKVNAPDALAFRALTRFLDGLNEEIARRVPSFLGAQAVVTFPLASFAAGVDLAALIPNGWKDLLDGFLTYSASPTGQPITIRGEFVPYEQRDSNRDLPAYTFLNNALIFLGQESDYTPFSTFTLTYTPLGIPVVNANTAIPLPDDCLEALAAMLAGFFLKRLVDDPQYRVTARTAGLYLQDAETMRGDFLRRIWRMTQRENYVVRDVSGAR